MTERDTATDFYHEDDIVSEASDTGYLSAEAVNKYSGEVHKLAPNSKATIQPVSLLRLGLFVPTLKSTARAVRRVNSTEASEELSCLSFAEAEGYRDIQIIGKRLDIDTDFKVWIGIVSCLFDYQPNAKGEVAVSFSEFITRCGYPRKRMSSAFRVSIDASLTNLASILIKFSKKAPHGHINSHNLHLIESHLDTANDLIVLVPNSRLPELYSTDYKRILKLKILDALGRKETAKALYTFFEALPKEPRPVTMDRLKKRLNLTSESHIQNSVIRKAMKDLEAVGYLEFTEKKKGREIEFLIHKRNP